MCCIREQKKGKLVSVKLGRTATFIARAVLNKRANGTALSRSR
jgi:hypothetical protein